ncbi:PDDEXK family nuclease [Cohnella rhizosphaerae]|uniref:Restriction endonuclease n=1 Tax=Cohnella rhizosphaerae TaxID=1457232 RepID=A0A9X4QSE4_9BACL|nr:hypothetical protein [Cohnella rhizosphaerae]MDG0808452.1 restriction endonuclease [Cohnella rhizosphaerae]
MARRKKKQSSLLELLVAPVMLGAFFLVFSATKSLVAGGIAFLMGGLILVVIGQMLKSVRLEKLKRSGIADIDKMDGYNFEKYLGQMFRSFGYQTEVT